MLNRTLLLVLLLISMNNASALLNPVVDTIPMRDGKWLMADIYIPAGWTSGPTILIQTPYNRLLFRAGLPLGILQNINSSPYAFVVVDWRGFYGSLPAAIASPNRGEDGYDVIEWISQQSWSDGKVGTWGPSALGKIQFETAREQHPSHICAVPQVANPWFAYEEFYPGGVYRTEYVEQLDALGYGLSATVLAHQVKDVVWNFAYNSTNYPSSINVPCLMIGGWYDHGTDPLVEYFNALRANSPIAVRDQHRLLMGPWVHGGHGSAYVGSSVQGELNYPAAQGWSDSLANLFFDYYLRGITNGWNTTPFVTYFQMGEDQWNTSSVWPPQGVSPIKLYLQNDHSLTSGLPINNNGSSVFSHDPTDPSPTHGGATLRADQLQGPYDQSSLVESRSDVLIFESPVLGQNVVMKGATRVHLFVSSDKTDTDFAIRLTDVYPDGRSMLIVDGIRRLRFRDGFTSSDTAQGIPGTIYELDVELPFSCITFLTGHKIRVDISSANYPRYDVNLNNGGIMYTSGDSLVAQNTVFHNSNQSSYVELMLTDFIGGVSENPYSTLNLYPNPAADKIMVEEIYNNCNYSIRDIQGKKVMNGRINNRQILVQSLVPGLYFIEIEYKGEKLISKWVKE